MQLIQLNRKKQNLPDGELLGWFIKSGDPDYLGVLYSRYLHLVYGVCLKYFKEPEKSKDAVIAIYEKIQLEVGNHHVKNFKSWLFVVTKNHCLMELRKSTSGKLLFTGSNEELGQFMENEPELHPIDEEQNNELHKVLATCIEQLKDEQKKCITLFYYQNKCYREIAGFLNMDEKKVKSHIQNGKRKLKICLEKKR